MISVVRIATYNLLLAATVLTAGLCFAQFQPRSASSPRDAGPGKLIRIEGGTVINEDTVRTARETVSHSTDTPLWTNPPSFDQDVFTFARVIFQSDHNAAARQGFGRRLGWWVDYPGADLNLSYRLQQLTSIRTDPDARVLPNRSWTELPMDHPIFHCVFDLQCPMCRPRVPTMQFWNEDHDPNDLQSPPQRVSRGEGWEEMHVRAMLDDAGRIMILAIHNSDVSDGWEREGENDTYFNRYSETIAYPLGINIVFYLMTH